MEVPDITSWQIPGSDEQPIYGNTHWPTTAFIEDPIWSGTLVCAHGFKGYKDYGLFPYLCDKAASAGLVAVRFNFSHSGMTNEVDTFQNPALFEKDRWSRQVYDLQQVLRFVDSHEDMGFWPVAVFGHSRGGVTSLLTAARDGNSIFYETPNRRANSVQLSDDWLAALITAAAPDYACNLDDLAKEQLRTEGRLLSPSGRTGQDLYVGRAWLDEIERDPELYDPVLAAAHVKCPTLIIHGSGDATVPVECAHHLHRAATPNSRLEIIEGASHTFDCPNPLPIDTPWEEVPPATRKLIDLTVSFAVEQCEKARKVSGGE